MKTFLEMRDQVLPIVDLDFVINLSNAEARYDDDQIAESIRGSNYQRTRIRINDFTERCNQTLDSLEERVQQTKAEYESLLAQAHTQEPGKKPSGAWVDSKNPNSVARYNEKVDRYNNQLDLYRRLMDKANRAKERYEDALEKYKDKKADLEDQINQRLAELEPALEQDIIILLDKMQQLTYNHIQDRSKIFDGFIFIYITKRIHFFLSDRVNTANERRSASDIIKKLDEELDKIALNQREEVKKGLINAARYFHACFKENESIFRNIQNFLSSLPYNECKENEGKASALTSLSIETEFKYQHIIDPVELAQVEREVQARKSKFGSNIESIEAYRGNMEPVFDKIAQVKSTCYDKLNKMVENKETKLDKLFLDIPFILNILDELEQDKHLKKCKQWLGEIELEINKMFEIELKVFNADVVNTDMLIRSAKELLEADEGLIFLSYRCKLDDQKKKFIEAIHKLDEHVEAINRLPHEKSEEVKRMMSSWLYISLIPIGNLAILYSIIKLIKKFLPALASTNSSYLALRETLIKKFQVFNLIHFFLIIGSVGVSFFVEIQLKPIFYALALSYTISSFIIFLKGSQLKKCSETEH